MINKIYEPSLNGEFNALDDTLSSFSALLGNINFASMSVVEVTKKHAVCVQKYIIIAHEPNAENVSTSIPLLPDSNDDNVQLAITVPTKLNNSFNDYSSMLALFQIKNLISLNAIIMLIMPFLLALLFYMITNFIIRL